MEAVIREYAPPRDTPAVLACIVELQEFERGIDPTLPCGTEMVEAYHAHLVEWCGTSDGTLFVVEVDGDVVGYVCILARVISRSADESREPYAYVSDLVVMPGARGRGLGRVLLDRAEKFARERGAHRLRINVLARNTVARELYVRFGFVERAVSLEKRL